MVRPRRIDENTARIMRYLWSSNAAQVAETKLEIESMPPDEAAFVLVSILSRARWIRRLLLFLSPAFVVAAFLGCDLLGLSGRDFDISAFFPVAGICLAVAWAASNRLRENTASVLVHLDNARLIDSLVMSFKSGTLGTHTSQDILTRLLPTLKPTQSHFVSSESRAFLNYALLHYTNKDFVLAILAAWEQIGDRDAIPIVEQLAGVGGFVEKEASIRDAAAAALPAIRESANRTAISQTLLRPAENGESTSLLRPAASGETTEAVLLRPATDQHTQ